MVWRATTATVIVQLPLAAMVPPLAVRETAPAVGVKLGAVPPTVQVDVAAGDAATLIIAPPAPKVGKLSVMPKFTSGIGLGLLTEMVRVVLAPPRYNTPLPKLLEIVGGEAAKTLML